MRKSIIVILIMFVILCICAPEGKGNQADDNIIRSVHTDKKMIALTFDDGPSAKFTPQILDILKENKIRSTFFCIGYKVPKNQVLMKRMAAEKHEIGNHTYTHPQIGSMGSKGLQIEIDKTQNAIYSTTGIKPKFFRPPGGRYNLSLLRVLKHTGHQMVLWSWDQDTRDWSNPGVRSIMRKVLKNASNGDIVLFHDTGGQTVRALRKIIPILKKEGFRMVTVSELLRNKSKKK